MRAGGRLARRWPNQPEDPDDVNRQPRQTTISSSRAAACSTSAMASTASSTSPSRPAGSPRSARTSPRRQAASRMFTAASSRRASSTSTPMSITRRLRSASIRASSRVARPCTTLVDAGSAGAGNYDGFRDYVMAHSPYRIFAFLNISFPGIFGFDKDVSIGEATLREMLPVRSLRRQDRGQSRPHHRRQGAHRRTGHRRTRPWGAGACAGSRRTP